MENTRDEIGRSNQRVAELECEVNTGEKALDGQEGYEKELEQMKMEIQDERQRYEIQLKFLKDLIEDKERSVHEVMENMKEVMHRHRDSKNTGYEERERTLATRNELQE